jgi:hypothetical protein
MRPEEIRSRLRPFAPFRIFTTTGEIYDVRSPDLLLLGAGSVVIGIPAQPDGHIYDRTVQLSLLHIVKIEALQTPATGNGQP